MTLNLKSHVADCYLEFFKYGYLCIKGLPENEEFVVKPQAPFLADNDACVSRKYSVEQANYLFATDDVFVFCANHFGQFKQVIILQRRRWRISCEIVFALKE